MTSRACLTIREHDYLRRGSPQECPDGCYIEDCDFDALKELLVPVSMLDDQEELDGADEDIEETSRRIFRLKNYKSEEVLQVCNFVGVIEAPTGQQIEILPKIGTSSGSARAKLLRMLRVARYLPAAQAFEAGLASVDLPLHALFVREFLASVSVVVRRGIIHGYQQVQTNQNYLKGRLLVGKNIRHNAARAERFYVAYQRFTPDRAENRLIRSAIDVAIGLTDDEAVQRIGRELRFAFEDVPPSDEFTVDFGRCVKDRSVAYYSSALEWARLILLEMAPLGSDGNMTACALLFPMEKVFERFVGECIDHALPSALRVETQIRREHLVKQRERLLFELRPDFLVSCGSEALCVLDAKWKHVDASDKEGKYGLSQADLYQTYAYGHKYLGDVTGRKRVCLIYPRSDAFTKPLDTFDFESDFTLHVLPLDIDSGIISGMDDIFNDQLPEVSTIGIPSRP